MNRVVFGEAVSETFGRFFGSLRPFYDLVTVPAILSLAIHLAAMALFGREDFALARITVTLLDLVPGTMFAVAWLRHLLLGPAGVAGPPGLAWTARETGSLLFFAWIAAVPGALFGLGLLQLGATDPAQLMARVSTPGKPPSPEDMELIETYIAYSMMAMAAALVTLRVAYGAAARALDLPWTPRDAWAYGRGSGSAIMATMILVSIAATMATGFAGLVAIVAVDALPGDGFGLGSRLVVTTATVYLSYAAQALMLTAVAELFVRTTGFQPGRALRPPP